MSASLARNWWAVALRGVVAILFGLVAIFMPAAVMLAIALFFAAYLIVDGVLGIIASVRAARRGERWGWLVAEGVLDVIVGIAIFFFPAGAVLAFVLVTGAWAIVTGGMRAWAATRLQAAHGRWWMVLSAVLSIVFGILLLIAPFVGAVVLTWWLGGFAIALGISLLVLAFKLHGQRNRPAHHQPVGQHA